MISKIVKEWENIQEKKDPELWMSTANELINSHTDEMIKAIHAENLKIY